MRYKKLFTVLFLLAACVQAIAQDYHFEGSIAQYKISLYLSTEDGKLYTGEYNYEGKYPIMLTGEKRGSIIYLEEFVDGKNTGLFELTLSAQGANGIWKKNAAAKPLIVSLNHATANSGTEDPDIFTGVLKEAPSLELISKILPQFPPKKSFYLYEPAEALETKLLGTAKKVQYSNRTFYLLGKVTTPGYNYYLLLSSQTGIEGGFDMLLYSHKKGTPLNTAEGYVIFSTHPFVYGKYNGYRVSISVDGTQQTIWATAPGKQDVVFYNRVFRNGEWH